MVSKNIHIKIHPYRGSGLLGYNNGLWNKLGLTRFVHPYYLTWENRRVAEQIIEDFDAQVYIEDDLAFTVDNFTYWLKYKDLCKGNGFNLGFLRVEYDSSNQAYLTDLLEWPQKTMELNGQRFMFNSSSPYCGLWIYDRSELKEFIKSKEWKFKFTGLGIREKSAIGWHGTMMDRYKGTLLPLHKASDGEYLLSKACIIHHIPNTYINDAVHCQLKLPKVIEII